MGLFSESALLGDESMMGGERILYSLRRLVADIETRLLSGAGFRLIG